MQARTRFRQMSSLLTIALLCSACSSQQNLNALLSGGKQKSASETLAKGQQNSESVEALRVHIELKSSSPSFPKTQNSPPEYVDSLDFVAPCRSAGCSVAHTGGHNLHWYVTQSQGDAGRAYYVKGEDQRCWERLDWSGESIKVTYDNCWWTDGYKYSRYADGRWLARIWKPGDAIVADHQVFGGNWDSCTDTPIGGGQKRKMTFLWRVKDFDWGPAGRLDTIAIRQSYPHEPRIREHYIYARGYGLIAWNYEDDSDPSKYMFNIFNQASNVKPVPVGTQCVQVENLNPQKMVAPSARPESVVAPVIAPQMPASAAVPAQKTQSPFVAAQATPSPQPVSTATGCAPSVLPGGSNFTRNQPLYSCSKKYSFVFQQDGNLVLYNTETTKAVWSSSTGGTGADKAIFQSDGNLVVYRAGSAVWDSKTGGQSGAELVIQDDGQLVIRKQGRSLWTSASSSQ